MFPLAAVACLALTAAAAERPRSWVDAQHSLGHLTGFRLQVDVHGSDADRGLLSADAVRAQMATTLQAAGIAVSDTGPDRTHAAHGLGALVLDVHVLAGKGGSSVAWTLQVSQAALVMSGAFTFATTWEVGDLIEAPPGGAAERLRANLQPALDEFCATYLVSRTRPREAPPAPRAPAVPRSPPEPPGTAL